MGLREVSKGGDSEDPYLSYLSLWKRYRFMTGSDRRLCSFHSEILSLGFCVSLYFVRKVSNLYTRIYETSDLKRNYYPFLCSTYKKIIQIMWCLSLKCRYDNYILFCY